MWSKMIENLAEEVGVVLVKRRQISNKGIQ